MHIRDRHYADRPILKNNNFFLIEVPLGTWHTQTGQMCRVTTSLAEHDSHSHQTAEIYLKTGNYTITKNCNKETQHINWSVSYTSKFSTHQRVLGMQALGVVDRRTVDQFYLSTERQGRRWQANKVDWHFVMYTYTHMHAHAHRHTYIPMKSYKKNFLNKQEEEKTVSACFDLIIHPNWMSANISIQPTFMMIL